MQVSRIQLLIKKQFAEQSKIYGIASLVLLAVLALMFVVIHQWRDSFSGAVQNGVFVIGLFVSGALFSSFMFQEFSKESSSIWLLSLPVRPSEQLLSRLIISVPIFLMAYLLLFYMVDISYLWLTDSLNKTALLDPFKGGFQQFFFWYFSFNALIFWGSITFNKQAFIKTLLLGIILLTGLNYVNGFVLSLMLPNHSIISTTLFDSFKFHHAGTSITVGLPMYMDAFTLLFVRAILPIALWFLTYLKFKEKQL